MQISEIRYFIRKVVLFLIFFIVLTGTINILFLILIEKTDLDFRKRIETQNFENPDYKLLVLGTSLAEYGIDTEKLTKLGIKSYNLSLVGAPVMSNYIQLKEYILDYSKKPSYVLLVNNSVLDPWDPNGNHPIIEFTMKNRRLNFDDLPLSKFRWIGVELVKKIFRKSYRDTYVCMGQKRSKAIIPDISDYGPVGLNLQEYRNAFWVEEIAELCMTNNIELIIINIPAFKETQNDYDIGPYEIYFDNGSYAVLFNLNSKKFCEFINAENDWCGLSHFNEFGAEKFTEQLYNVVFGSKLDSH